MDPSKVIYRANLSLVIFLQPLILFLISCFVYFQFPRFSDPALIFIFISIVWAALVGITYQYSYLVVTKAEVILRKGFFVRELTAVPLLKIESVDIKQSLIGAIFKYGSIVITGTGGTKQIMNYIHRPLTVRRHIEERLAGY